MHTFEELDGEMVLFNEESEQIVILNQTAVYIWNEIVACEQIGADIQTVDIVNVLRSVYNLSEDMFETLHNDVDETIEELLDSGLLVV